MAFAVGDKVRGKGVYTSLYGECISTSLPSPNISVVIQKVDSSFYHGAYRVGDFFGGDPIQRWELEFKVGDSIHGRSGDLYDGYCGVITTIHSPIYTISMDLNKLPPQPSTFKVGSNITIFERYFELDALSNNVIFSGNIIINNTYKPSHPVKYINIPAGRAEKPCRLKTCGRMNDLGVKKCWHCEIDNPTQ